MTELDDLKAQADALGISYRENIGVDTLKEKILKFQGSLEEVEQESESEKIARMRAECLKLIRVIVTPMDPMKRNYQGEVISVSNSLLGVVKKFVLFNAPYHLPKILVDELREKKFQTFQTKKAPGGQEIRQAKSIPAYGIQELAPLTPEELKELGKIQQARSSIED